MLIYESSGQLKVRIMERRNEKHKYEIISKM
jgi:hypothetical protein